MKYINETLLLFPSTVDFRRVYPELVKHWEIQIMAGNCSPDLYFCLSALDAYPRLKAYLNSREYLFDFVINAHLLYDRIVSRSVVDGHLEGEAVELGNQEILLVYRSLDESPEIVKDPLANVYYGLFENGDESVDAEKYIFS